ncbi:MAG: DUF4129 domain-containing protein [Thermoactinospora sp.]|nr:DUF4129 domain-containing protein [Thermoactinospora sp.]
MPLALIVAGLVAVGLTAGTISDFKGDFNSSIGDFSWAGQVQKVMNQDEKAEADGVFGYRDSSFDTNLWVTIAGFALVSLLVITILVILYHLIKHLLKKIDPPLPSASRGPGVEFESEPEPVRAAVRASLEELDEGDDPRRAVIACWLRLERAATEAGMPPMAADTPEELVARLLEDLDEEALQRLKQVYHLARYAPHEVSEEQRAVARQALETLIAATPVVEPV